MKCTTLSYLSAFYETDTGRFLVSAVVDSVNKILNKKDDAILTIGWGGYYLDKLDNGKLYYAVPNCFPIEHWPKIRSFKTIIIDEERLPFQSDTWEIVIVIHFIELIKESAAFLEEVFRVTKTNGRLIIIAVNKLSNVYNSMLFPSETNIKYDTAAIIDMVSRAQFHINSVFGINKKFKFWPYSFSCNFNNYNNMLIKIFPFLSDIVIISAQKTVFSPEVLESLEPQYEI